MGFFDSIKKIFDAVEDAGSKTAEKTAPVQSAAKPGKNTPADVIDSGNVPPKPDIERKAAFFGGETGDDEFDVSFMLSGDFIEFDSHCEVLPAFQYEPKSNVPDDEYTGYEENLPHIGIGPDKGIYGAVKEFEKSGILPGGDYERCSSEYFAFRGSFEAHGRKYYAYAFRSGTPRECEMLSVDYRPDVCGTNLERKLKAVLDKAASTYKETKVI